MRDYLLQLSFTKDRQVRRLAERGVSVDGSWHDENRLTLGCAGQPARRQGTVARNRLLDRWGANCEAELSKPGARVLKEVMLMEV